MSERRKRPEKRDTVKIQPTRREKNQAGRPGRGAGTSISDVWHPDEHKSEAKSIDDDRRNRTVCKDCGQDVMLLQHDGKWYTRNLDGLPHALTCGDET